MGLIFFSDEIKKIIISGFLLIKYSAEYSSFLLNNNSGGVLDVFKFFLSHSRSAQNTKSIISSPYLIKYKFSRYFYVGLGYKIFLRLNKLYIWLGLTHYTILDIPLGIKVFTRKKRLFIIGLNKIKFNEFIFKLRNTRKVDLYKGKGLLEIKTYKGFIKMKAGKKKQY